MGNNQFDYEYLVGQANNTVEEAYIKMLIVRRFEENLLRLFGENKLFGTTHTCIGQEAIAVSVMSYVDENDVVFSNHRGHGHFISYSHKPEILLKEIMGKKGGVCEGKGGSQHISYKNFYTNGVQGGIVPNAVGAAWAKKIQGNSAASVVFLGDGTLGQGIVYESLNIASIKSIPVLFVVEENGYAMSTSMNLGVGGSIPKRAEAFGISWDEVDGNDFETINTAAEKAIKYVKTEGKPFMLVAHTYRLAAHSKGDDFRPSEEVEEHRKNDPLLRIGKLIDPIKKELIDDSIQRYIEQITEDAANAEYAELVIKDKDNQTNTEEKNIEIPEFKHCIEYVNYALRSLLAENEKVFLMGEDICDPYGGAFKATKGLSTEYPDRVENMPISEAAMAGISVGMAMQGLRPVTEIMFGDFITLTVDQLINHASKYGWIYNKDVPMIIRTPMGGGRGYGPTHSQSLEKYICGIPGVNVFALSMLHNPVHVYRKAVSLVNPIVVIENKKLYSQPIINADEQKMIRDFFVKKVNKDIIPTYELSLNSDFESDAVIITYGGMVNECMEASRRLMIEDEVAVNIVVLGQLSGLPWGDLSSMGLNSKSIITVEEGTSGFGIGAELIAGLTERKIGKMFSRVEMLDLPIPNSLLLEKEVLPNCEKIISKVRMSL